MNKNDEEMKTKFTTYDGDKFILNGLTFKMKGVREGVPTLEVVDIQEVMVKPFFIEAFKESPATSFMDFFEALIKLTSLDVCNYMNRTYDRATVYMRLEDVRSLVSSLNRLEELPKEFFMTGHVIIGVSLHERTYMRIEVYDDAKVDFNLVNHVKEMVNKANDYNLRIPHWEPYLNGYRIKDNSKAITRAIAAFFMFCLPSVDDDLLPASIVPLKPMCAPSSGERLEPGIVQLFYEVSAKDCNGSDVEMLDKALERFFTEDVINALSECVKADLSIPDKIFGGVHFDSVDCESLNVEYGSREFCRLVAIAALNKFCDMFSNLARTE